MRIRKKLILLHTGFSVVMAVVLLLSIRPAATEVVRRSTETAARAAIRMVIAGQPDEADDVRFSRGDAVAMGISKEDGALLRSGAIVTLPGSSDVVRVGAWNPGASEFVVAQAALPDTGWVIRRIDTLLILAIVGIYLAVAAALEIYVLPRHVYGPIQRLRRADLAVQEGDRRAELIPEDEIPSDELGEIMRSRNHSITSLREHERALTDALERLETIAADLRQKNLLIENAQRNLADQDRLASLGVMSAGLAHEMNTPLSVLKGAVESIVEKPADPVPEWQSALMLRVIGRLERLSDGLLDFARVRPAVREPVAIRDVVEEAWTLVSLDRASKGIAFTSGIDAAVIVPGDADRLTQVFVNILRNSVDAMEGRGRIDIIAQRTDRESRQWLEIRIANNGPRIDPDILPRLFEPFESTRLDDRGTGLGLAIAEGIIREHGGFIAARNLPDRGCVFEIVLPFDLPPDATGGNAVRSDPPEGPA
ncbi:MAG: hypothetical protein H6814_11470 [Phycisphaeraceae bacterium]|nr:hypothetical protein [Phycisphaeraceae bacterium]